MKKLVKEDSTVNQEMIEEKEVIIKELDVIIDNKGALEPPCEDCETCKNEKEVCKCICRKCEEVNPYLLNLTLNAKSYEPWKFYTVEE